MLLNLPSVQHNMNEEEMMQYMDEYGLHLNSYLHQEIKNAFSGENKITEPNAHLDSSQTWTVPRSSQDSWKPTQSTSKSIELSPSNKLKRKASSTFDIRYNLRIYSDTEVPQRAGVEYCNLMEIFSDLADKVVFLDLETTDVKVSKAKIIQIGAIEFDTVKYKIKKYCRLVNTSAPITPEATAVHGISYEKIKNQLGIKGLHPEIFNLLQDAVVIGYNILEFDWPVLINEHSRRNLKMAKVKGIFDVGKLCWENIPADFKRTLTNVRDYLVDPSYPKTENAHDALADCIITLQVLNAITEGPYATDWHLPTWNLHAWENANHRYTHIPYPDSM